MLEDSPHRSTLSEYGNQLAWGFWRSDGWSLNSSVISSGGLFHVFSSISENPTYIRETYVHTKTIEKEPEYGNSNWRRLYIYKLISTSSLIIDNCWLTSVDSIGGPISNHHLFHLVTWFIVELGENIDVYIVNGPYLFGIVFLLDSVLQVKYHITLPWSTFVSGK